MTDILTEKEMKYINELVLEWHLVNCGDATKTDNDLVYFVANLAIEAVEKRDKTTNNKKMMSWENVIL